MGQIVVSPNAGFFSRSHKTIGQALKAASSGDEIFLEEGNYREEVIVDKPVSLISKASGAVVINGAVHVRSKSVQLESLTIEHRISESALHIHPHSEAGIANCAIRGRKTHNTVFVYEHSVARFTGSRITSGRYGLAVDRALCMVTDCEIENTEDDGLFATAGATVRIDRINIHDCGKSGISATEPQTQLVIADSYVHNVGTSGIFYLEAQGSITNCKVENCAIGLSINQARTVISGGEIRSCAEVGIVVTGERSSPSISNIRLNEVGSMSLAFMRGARGRLTSRDYEPARGELGIWADQTSAPTIEADARGYLPKILKSSASA